MINNVVLVGRLGNDPELTYANSGTAIAKFRLAVNRPRRRDADAGQEDVTDWLNIVTFGRVAETCNQYLTKGALVGIEGRIQSRTWERQDGTKGYGVEINARWVQFLESRRDREAREGAAAPSQQGAQAPPPQQGAQAPPPQQGAQAPPPGDSWPGDEDEDPFRDQ